jgi:uncharacterized protein with von Willebrand factor type A (vWA) domain
MADAPPRDLVAAVVRLTRALRARGVPATAAEAADAARALGHADLGDREEVYLALRTVLAARRADFAAFDELFAALWDDAPPDERRAAARAPSPAPRPLAPPADRRAVPSLERWLGGAPAESLETEVVARASDRRAHGRGDFAGYGDRELDEVMRIARRIARRRATRRSRRWRAAARGRRVDPRRTMRQTLATGGEAAILRFRERRRRRTALVALCDVSGSMDLHARLLLQLLYALQRSFSRVETFAFSTHLTRISGALRAGSYREALDRLGREPGGWSGGTRIGESLAELLERWPRLLDRRTIVLVLSDGWDTGDPALLADALRAIRRRARRVIWLNPLLGAPSYRPLARGMRAALPHVDVFAPAHDLASLEALGRWLRG